MKSKTWAVIGAGNGGQALAGHLSMLGQRVRIYDKFSETVQALNKTGYIRLSHALEGNGKIEFATDCMQKAMDGADIIVIVLPSLYHESISKECIPNLRDGQVVFLSPEASCGAMAFRKLMRDMDCAADVVVGAASILLYACRSIEPGNVCIYGIKNEVSCAALPASDNKALHDAIADALPWFKLAPNVIYTSLLNSNAFVHPAPTIFNTSRIEAEPPQECQYYLEAITPSIGRYIENMSKERAEIAQAYGLEMMSISEQFATMYDCGSKNDPLYLLCRNNPAYEGIMMAKTLRTRYMLEDIPYSLMPIQALAQTVGIKTPYIDSIVSIGRNLLEGQVDEGRTAKALGIDHMTKDELLRYVSG